MPQERRSYKKTHIIAECAQADTSITNVALTHNLNANLVHKYIRGHRLPSSKPRSEKYVSPRQCWVESVNRLLRRSATKDTNMEGARHGLRIL